MNPRVKFAALLAGLSAPLYFVIQLVFGSGAGAAARRSLFFLVVIFLVSLAIDWDRRARSDSSEAVPAEEDGSSNSE
jgi:hypothetical protein